MSDSSQHPPFTITSNELKKLEDFIINIDDLPQVSLDNTMASSSGDYYNYSYSSGIDTITLTGTAGQATNMNYSSLQYTLPSLTTDQISALSTSTINSITIDSSGWSHNWIQKDWEGQFPNWNRVQDMCSKYPGLKNAFDNFKVFYEMVKDDYDNPTPKK